MTQSRERKGPRGHRFLVLMLNIILAILFYWLLGFILDDIASQPGPSLTEIQNRYKDKKLVSQEDLLNKQLNKLNQTISAQTQQQSLLKSSIDGYRDTMNQLLDLQKSSMQKGVSFSSDTQQNLTNVTKLYLDNQQKFQNLNHEMTYANAEAQQLQSQINSIDVTLQKQSEQAYHEYETQITRYYLEIAAIQLLILLPLLIVVAYLFKKYRHSIYRSMIMAIGAAIILKIVFVMHDNFPSRFFKYFLILILIYLVVRSLRAMLHMIVAPQKNWLIKQYREAYQKMQCAMCQYPIQPGIFKLFMPQNTKGNQPTNMGYLEHVDTYTCPSCGEHLFEKCDQCQHLRHSLLTYCDNCGAEKILKKRCPT